MNFWDIIEKILSNNAVLYFSFGYIITKIITRTLIRNLMSAPVDIWDILAWFSMDIAFINIALLITKGMYEDSNLQIFIYVFLTFAFTLVILILYGFFVKRRVKVKDSHPINDLRLFGNISLGYFIGFLNLHIIYSSLW